MYEAEASPTASTVLFDQADDGTGGSPEVLRGELRQLLLDSLPANTVRWGHKVSATRALGEGRHQVTFADGTTVATDLLVGADGAWSRVRPLLSDTTPEYIGMSGVETHLFDADTRHPADAKSAAATARIAREFAGWAPELTALIADRDTAPVLRPRFVLPVEHRWDRVPG